MKILDASANDSNNYLTVILNDNYVIDLQNINYSLYKKIKCQPTDTIQLKQIADELNHCLFAYNFEGVILPKGSPELLWILGRLWRISSPVVPFFIVSTEHTGDQIKLGMM